MHKKHRNWVLALPALLLVASLSACSSESTDSSASASCTPADLKTITANTLTIATGEPAYPPWVEDDKPESGRGFEAAVAYAVAKQLGYTNDQVKWVRTTFDGAIAPGPKNFDFNIQQYSITDEREQVVDFSSAYYKSNQAIVTFKGSKIAGVKSIDAVEKVLGLKASVFNDNAAAVAALKNKQIDGIVVDLPTAFYLSAAEVENGVIAGQFKNVDGADKGAGLLLANDSPITACVTGAVDALRDNGQLAAIETEWLTASAGAPVLN